jgi:hypothetical protein
VFYPDENGLSSLTPTEEAAAERLRVIAGRSDPWAEEVLAPDKAAVWVQTAERGQRQHLGA